MSPQPDDLDTGPERLDSTTERAILTRSEGTMAFDENLAERIRKALGGRRDVSEKKMFGGIAFMVRGNMCCGAVGNDLMVRVGSERYESALGRPHARPMDFTGKPLTGMVYVGPKGCTTDAAVARWVDEAAEFAMSLPEKAKGAKGAKGGKGPASAKKAASKKADGALRKAKAAPKGR
jgi:TfoX/Sxy family transcriptional regulator of competence genes